MRMHAIALALLALSGLALGNACTVSAGVGTCTADGLSCTYDAECCSNFCSNTDTCGVPVGCTEDYQSCASSTECCSQACSAGVCDPSVCLALGDPCTSDNECCDADYCDNGACSPCVTAGNACSVDADCCSALCDAGACAP